MGYDGESEISLSLNPEIASFGDRRMTNITINKILFLQFLSSFTFKIKLFDFLLVSLFYKSSIKKC